MANGKFYEQNVWLVLCRKDSWTFTFTYSKGDSVTLFLCIRRTTVCFFLSSFCASSPKINMEPTKLAWEHLLQVLCYFLGFQSSSQLVFSTSPWLEGRVEADQGHSSCSQGDRWLLTATRGAKICWNIGEGWKWTSWWQLKCFLYSSGFLGKWSILTDIFPKWIEGLLQNHVELTSLGSVRPLWDFWSPLDFWGEYYIVIK